MKKHFILLFFFAFALIGGLYAITDDTKEPKAVALNFVNALKAKEFVKAKKYGTEATNRILDMLEAENGSDSTRSKIKAPKVTTKILDAVVDVNQCHIRLQTSDMPDEEQTMTLTKTNGKWLVEMTKDDLEE